MRLKLTCTRCGITLKNELDTFGDIGHEMCENCWYEYYEEMNGIEYYGMAPHYHDLTITGHFIGSTILLDYSDAKRDERGRYWIENMQMWFTPDDEVDGAQGMWQSR